MDARRFDLPLLLALPGFVALLAEPLLWLAGTWLNSFYGGSGILVAAGCLWLLLRSVCSGAAAPDPQAAPAAVRLLLGAAALRLAGRMLAVNIVGAFALCLDLWALGLILRLRGRPWPVQPAALAALFAFSMPAERILQRLLGQPLRLASSIVAETLLAPVFSGLQRAGTLLSWDGLELDIDLPCSGARGLLMLCTLGLALACRRRLDARRLVLGSLAVAGGALVANTTRIVLLFAGSAASLPVLQEPWHTMIGLLGLGLGAIPLLICAMRWNALRPEAAGRFANRPHTNALLDCANSAGSEIPRVLPRNLPGSIGGSYGDGSRAALPVHGGPETPVRGGMRSRFWALAFSAGALAIALAPSRPVDVSRSDFSRRLPANLGDMPGQSLRLSAQEKAYFAAFGGSAQKRAYQRPGGPRHSVLLVTSSAPLRHLHEPEECLSYAGYSLQKAGLLGDRTPPTVVWKAEAPDGTSWRVEVSYISETGRGAAYLSEVVWRWMAQPAIAWSLVERISPWSACETDPRPCREFDRTLFSALDVRFEEVSL